jgi:hypothetical protein
VVGKNVLWMASGVRRMAGDVGGSRGQGQQEQGNGLTLSTRAQNESGSGRGSRSGRRSGSGSALVDQVGQLGRIDAYSHRPTAFTGTLVQSGNSGVVPSFGLEPFAVTLWPGSLAPCPLRIRSATTVRMPLHHRSLASAFIP